MEITFSKSELNPEIGPTKEWLLTNGIGGFAASTIIGLNTRRYHGLLIASLRPPIDRRLLVAKLDEDLYLEDRKYVLGANQVHSGYAQRGYEHLQRFRRNPFPTFTYHVDDVFIIKKIFMIYGRNTTVVNYRIINEHGKKVTLQIFPLVNCRDYHAAIFENDWPFQQEVQDFQVKIEPFRGAPCLYLASDQARYVKRGSWYKGMYYTVEEYRGLPCYEDHYIPGYFVVHTQTSEDFTVVLSTEEVFSFNYAALEAGERERLQSLLDLAGYQDEFAQQLVLAADAFLVQRESTGKRTIIAGYPWFSDWGRDAMIALPGLTLCTKRFPEAREILATFAAYEQEGLIPNMFPDAGEAPLYNTVDAPLWYFYAVQKFLAYTADYGFIKENIFPTLKRIIAHYQAGTKFGIKMDQDGLIVAKCSGLQLTWMDAKVGNWVVTPREGKPVEVNALWYNALCFMAQLAPVFGEPDKYSELAEKVRTSFRSGFWNEVEHCLYDVINTEIKDARIRPNQVLAVSLPFSPLTRGEARAVVSRVWEELYAVYGLRSLSPRDPEFKGRYGGNQVERDAAYHQGTVWSWFLGHFITAYRKVHGYSSESLEVARLFLSPMRDHLRDHGVGTISEIFDGAPPFTPRGCFAQAWGVAEVLRSYVEDLN
ncbi:MAG: amylo-alpha-1,6-glucosidase [Bacillota bacterium]|nr:amylo-alpha-1,6-glucosidase [Bacillota bacterium]